MGKKINWDEKVINVNGKKLGSRIRGRYCPNRRQHRQSNGNAAKKLVTCA